MNLIKKIMSTRYKYAFVGIIIMIIVFIFGIIMIQGMSNVIEDQNIISTDTVVDNKYLDENNNQFYIVVGKDNRTFDIKNNNQGVKMYDSIMIGQHYRFTAQNDTNSPMLHIVQVYNDTN